MIDLQSEEMPTETELEGGFSRRRLAWGVGVAVTSFVIFLLLLAYGHDLEGRPAPGANTFSRSALGYQGVAELLRSLGLGVVSRQASAGSGVGPDRPLVVAEPDIYRKERLDTLWQEAENRKATLVLVLPKWAPGEPQKDKPDWLAQVKPMSLDLVERSLGRLRGSGHRTEVQRFARARSCEATWQGEEPTPLRIDTGEVVQLLRSEELEPLIQCEGDDPDDRSSRHHDQDPMVFVNPVITPVGQDLFEDWEGCLSIPDLRGRVPRVRAITVTALDRKGSTIQFSSMDFPARVIQHETDHLDGVLFVDRMRNLGTLSFLDEYQRYWTKDTD